MIDRNSYCLFSIHGKLRHISWHDETALWPKGGSFLVGYLKIVSAYCKVILTLSYAYESNPLAVRSGSIPYHTFIIPVLLEKLLFISLLAERVDTDK